MPKVIAPRRANKNVTVEQYWSIREDLTKPPKPQANAYKSEEVTRRFRYSRLSDKVQAFNPLAYFLRKKEEPASMQKTHTHDYLQSINYRLPEEIMEVKRMMFGLASILTNLSAIYSTLWEHHGTEDSWRLMQTLLLDTRGESYEGWIKQGLSQIVSDLDNTFQQTRFRVTFDTLCIFMEVNFSSITSSLESLAGFLEVMATHYFTHPNKYLRKFSLKASSYILTNIQDEAFTLLLNSIAHPSHHLHPYLPEILAYRLRYSSQCLTPNSVEELVHLIGWLSVDPERPKEIAEQFLSKVLCNLEIKQSLEESETLFDFGYIVKALIELAALQKVSPSAVATAVLSFLNEQLPRGRKRSLTPPILQEISQFLWMTLPQQPHCSSTYELISMCLDYPLSNLPNIQLFLAEETDASLINGLLDRAGKASKDTIEVLMFSLKKWVESFCLNSSAGEQDIEVVYRIVLMLKQRKMDLNIQIIFESESRFQSFINQIHTLISAIWASNGQTCYQYALTLLRLLNVAKLLPAHIAPLIPALKALADCLLVKYSQSLEESFKRKSLSGQDSLFSCDRHVIQIFTYSHSEVSFLFEGMNVLESLIELERKLSAKFVSLDISSLECWHRVALNRASLSTHLASLIKSTVSLSTSNSFISLSSRHRTVREQTLKSLLSSGSFGESGHEIGEILLRVDFEDVDLDNERDIKKELAELERIVKSRQLPLSLNAALLDWSLGFAFTGFKLVETHFCQLLSALVENQNELDLEHIFQFLEYYTFRNSRVFNQEKTKFFSDISQMQLPPTFRELTQEDFGVEELETAEFIGIDRVTTAIGNSEKVKKRLGTRLEELVNAYFQEEFPRSKKVLLSCEASYMSEDGVVNELLLPPKTTFLKQILKIVPAGIKPPLECLHLCHEVLKVQSFSRIKRQEWELLWDKKSKWEHSRIKFEEMSMEERGIYIHFLWGQLLKADANRIRVILQHVRENLPQMVDYLMKIYFDELTVGASEPLVLQTILQNMDSRKLLTFIYILKAAIKTLRNFIRTNIPKVVGLLISIIQTFETSSKEPEEEDEQEEAEEVEEQQEKEGMSQPVSSKKYKNHRREIYQLLNSLVEYTAESLELATVQQIMEAFSRQGKVAQLSLAALGSTPGLLLFLQQISAHPKFHPIFFKFGVMEQLSSIVREGHLENQNAPIVACVSILKNILGIRQQGQMAEEGAWEEENRSHIRPNALGLLDSLRQFLVERTKKEAQKAQILSQALKIVLKLMQIAASELSGEWAEYLLSELQRMSRQKVVSERQNARISLVLSASMEYSRRTSPVLAQEFLLRVMGVIPHLKEVQHRRLISEELTKDFPAGGSIISVEAARIVTQLNTTVKDSIMKELDFPEFFAGVSSYREKINSFSLHEHEYIIYNTLPYLVSEELSVRKAVNSCVQSFLKLMGEQQLAVVSKLFRAVCDWLKKPLVEQVFWAVGSCVAHFVRWVVSTDATKDREHYSILTNYVQGEEHPEKDLFELLSALSQSKKLEGLKMLKEILSKDQTVIRAQAGDKLPNIIGAIVLPILEHFILPQPTIPGAQYALPTNLGSTLSHVSLEVYEVMMLRGGESLQKKELKRLVSKIKFSDENLKKNILIVKMIGQIVESIGLTKSTEVVKQTIEESGFEEFHRRILEKESNLSKIREEEADSDSEEEVKRQAFNRINNEIDDEELININYLSLDKKLMDIEEETEARGDHNMVKFLRRNILAPLKTMLMFENKSSKGSKEETDRSRMFLSVVVTKIIVKFPMDVFLTEMQKVLSKLCRLLKKKQVDVRENARKCLAEIAKLVGPNMLYMIVRELKFHLRDNLQQHILNYTIYYILEKAGPFQPAALDHCLPLLLPPVVDEIFGRSSVEKEMVDEHLIPTIYMESKKKKGFEVLGILCRQICAQKVSYLVQYLEKFLKEYMNSEANLAKYDQLLIAIISGFSRNAQLMLPSSAPVLTGLLYESIEELKVHIKLNSAVEEGPKHESTVKQGMGSGKKVGLKETYELQEQAGRNASIFRKQARVLASRRNHDVMVTSFMQLHLSLLGLLIKKKVLGAEEAGQGEVGRKFESIINFVIECVEQRDNRLVHKCLKIIHTVIHWDALRTIAQMRKKVCRKIFALIEKLTSADEDLLRECFTLLNDLFLQVTITREILPTLLTIVKLHITGSDHGVLEEPYRLFKTILHKISGSALILEEGIYELYELVRMTMINSSLDDIRSICRSICLIFMRQEVPAGLPGPKKNSLNFASEVSFYLNNLDCKYAESQSCILDILEEYTHSRSKKELEETGEVIIMSIGTAYANGTDNRPKMVKVIQAVCAKIDKAKVIALAEKCLVWMSNTQNQLISNCGYFLFQCIAASHQLPPSVVAGSTLACEATLQGQANKLQEYYEGRREAQMQREAIKNNPQWATIITRDEVSLQIDSNMASCIEILSHSQPNLDSASSSRLIDLLWKLVAAPSDLIFQKVARLLLTFMKLVPSIGLRLLSEEKDEPHSMKKKILEMVSCVSVENTPLACELLKKVLGELEASEQFGGKLQSWVGSLINKIGRCILNLRKFEKQMVVGLTFLKALLSLSASAQQHLLSAPKLIDDLFWNLSKIARNDLVEEHVKEKNEEVMEIVKLWMGESAFYTKLANTEAARKDKKNVEKVEMARLAITDQAAFEQAKARKKHKKG